MKEIKVQGFTSDTRPDDRPSVAIFATENCGKSRFGCSLPHDDGCIAFVGLDKNTKRTVEEHKTRFGTPIIINQKQYISDRQALDLARMETKDDDGKAVTENIKKVRKIYGEAVDKVIEDVGNLSINPNVESVVLDTASQLFDWILFSHFGRKNQIESFSRAAPNQDMIDIINMLRNKNSLLVHKATEIWKETGEVDRQGNKKSSPTGQYKPEGFGKIGFMVTAVCQLESKKIGAVEANGEREEVLNKKYRIKVVTCKGNTLLEGRDLADLGVCGEVIGWESLMMAIGVEA